MQLRPCKDRAHEPNILWISPPPCFCDKITNTGHLQGVCVRGREGSGVQTFKGAGHHGRADCRWICCGRSTGHSSSRGRWTRKQRAGVDVGPGHDPQACSHWPFLSARSHLPKLPQSLVMAPPDEDQVCNSLAWGRRFGSHHNIVYYLSSHSL